MKGLLKKSIVGVLILVMCMGLLSVTALAADDETFAISDGQTISDVSIEVDVTADDEALVANTIQALSDVSTEVATYAADSEALVIDSDQTISNVLITGDVYIVKGVTLTTTDEVTISGSVYVFGTLENRGTLDVSGTLHCLHYNSIMSAGADYDYGYYRDYGDSNISVLVVNADYLSVSIPEGTTSESEPDSTTDSDTGSTTNSGSETTTDSSTGAGTNSATATTATSGTGSTTGSTEHTYDFESIIWDWAEDYSSATAYVYCVDGDGAVMTIEADVESFSNDDGGVTYVASITDEEGNIYTDQIVLNGSGDVIADEFIEISDADSSSDSSGTSSGSGYSGTSSGSGSSGTGSSSSSGSSSGGSGSSSGSSSSVSSAKTDDSATPYLYLSLILIAGAAIVTVSIRRSTAR